MTLSVIKDMLIKPLDDQHEKLEEKLDRIINTMGGGNGIRAPSAIEDGLGGASQQLVQQMNENISFYSWKEHLDEDSAAKYNDRPRKLPFDYEISSKRSLLQIWYIWLQYHECKNYTQITPLREVQLQDFHKSTQRRKFSLLAKICSKLDEVTGCMNNATQQRPSINDLDELFLNTPTVASHILPVDLTDHGRTRRRKDELTWGTVARQYEQRNPVAKRRRPALNNEDN